MSVSRRTLLRSGAATLFLPFLPSALPSSARAATGPAPKRLLFWFVPNGILYDPFRPSTEGADYELCRFLEPIASLRHRMTPLSGILNGVTSAGNFSAHEQCLASLLTDVDIDRVGNLEASNSLDQFIAGSLESPVYRANTCLAWSWKHSSTESKPDFDPSIANQGVQICAGIISILLSIPFIISMSLTQLIPNMGLPS